MQCFVNRFINIYSYVSIYIMEYSYVLTAIAAHLVFSFTVILRLTCVETVAIVRQ